MWIRPRSVLSLVTLHDDEFLTRLAYLGDVFSRLNDLNLGLQGLSATFRDRCPASGETGGSAINNLKIMDIKNVGTYKCLISVESLSSFAHNKSYNYGKTGVLSLLMQTEKSSNFLIIA